MTTAQQRRLYFPAWQAAAKNHGWHKSGGSMRVEFFGTPELNALYQRVCTIASERARASACAASPDDYRHACHIVAFGEDVSSSALTNKQLDRILALFRLLADPDDLRATLAWNNPQDEQRKRLLWWLKNNCREAYIVSISRERFGTDDWESLDFPDLRQLHMTLKNRSAAQKPPRAAATSPDFVNVSRETADNVPF